MKRLSPGKRAHLVAAASSMRTAPPLFAFAPELCRILHGLSALWGARA